MTERSLASKRVDAASLAAFRFAFGAMMAVGLVRFLALGWVRPQLAEPTFHFKYPGFAWVPVWAEWGLVLHFAVLAVLAACVAIGFRYRVAIVLFTIGFLHVQLMDVTNYLNHYWLVVSLALVMCFLPLHRTWSVDAGRGAEDAPAWWIWLLRAQVGLVYFHAGLAKAEPDWLLHGQPLGIWMSTREELPVIGPVLALPWIGIAMAWAGFLFDTTIAGWLLWKRTRLPAYAVLVVFHVLTRVLFPIGMFPAIMIVSALVFFPPDWPRRLLRLAPAAIGPATKPARLALAAGALWIALFAIVPLRHFAFPGSVLWNEQGMRFAWKVMLREKAGSVTYHVSDPASGRRWVVSPSQYLTWRQTREFATQPDLIAQLGRHIAADFARRGHPGVEVRAEAHVSLNGRAPALLLDPSVNLAGALPDGWILPAPDGPPLPLPRVAQARAP